MKYKLLKPSLITAFLLILGGAGSLLFGWFPFIGAVLIICGLAGSIYSIWETDRRNKELDTMLETHAILFSKSGIGNIYSESIKTELKKTGSVKNIQPTLLKALEIDPYNLDALSYMGMGIALSLSFDNWANIQDQSFYKKQLTVVKQIIKSGKKKYPTESVFYDIQGIIYDFEGKHKEARKEFIKSGEIREDFGWKLLMSTSWHMSHEEEKALKEIEEYIALGAKGGWLIDFYYGRALRENDRIEDAYTYLLSAFNKRKFRPELLEELSMTSYNLGYMFTATKFSLFTCISLLGKRNNKFFRMFMLSINSFYIGVFSYISKKLWLITNRIYLLKKIQLKYFPPDEPEFTLGVKSLESGYFNSSKKLFKKSCLILPEKFETFANLAVCYALLGDFTKSEQTFQKAILLAPNDVKLKKIRDRYLNMKV